MGLKLKLSPREKIVINGCLVKNGAAGAMLEVENFSNIIREKDILHEKDINTPMKSIYFAIQALIISPARNEDDSKKEINRQYDKNIMDLMATLFNEEKDTYIKDCIMRCVDFYNAGDYYKALKEIRAFV